MKRIKLGVLLTVVLLTIGAAIADETDSALELAREWQAGDAIVIRSPEGRVLFSYGQAEPTVVCAIFQLCDLRLEPGETVQTVNVGDTERWDISQSRSGEGELTSDHVVIKPLAADIRTTLFIGTDRRSYLVELVGTERDNMGQVGFLYGPSRNAVASRGGSDIELLPPRPDPPAPTAPPPEPVGRAIVAENLNFGYDIRGDRVVWRPVRVYDDGTQTFIDFDRARVTGRELPIFLVNDTESRGSMVNYRYDTRGRMVVDGLFDRGTLMLGKGRRAQKVHIERDSVRQAETS